MSATSKRDLYVLFYAYDDATEVPYIVVNPPRNFTNLLKQWNELDRRFCADDLDDRGWDGVEDWLESKGVRLIEAETVRLDDFYSEDSSCK